MRFDRNSLLAKTGHGCFILVIALLAILARVTYFVIQVPYDPEAQAQDRDLYLQIARHLIAGRGFSMGPDVSRTVPTASRGPATVYLFAAVIWLFGDRILPAACANWLADGITAGLIYLIAWEIVGRRSVAWVASFLFVCYVPEIYYSWQALSEPLFTVLLAAFVLCLVRALRLPSLGRFAVCGAFLGAATLSRPIVQYFAPVAVMGSIILLKDQGRRLWGWMAGLFLSFVAVLTPWTVRNYVVFGRFIPSSSYLGHNLYATHYVLEEDDYLRPRDFEMEAMVVLDKLLQQRLGPDYKSFTTQPERDEIAKREAFRIIRQYPIRYAILSATRFFRLWYYVYGAAVHGTSPPWIIYPVAILHSGLWALAVLALLRYRGKWMKRSIPFSLLLLYYALVHSVVHVQVRYIVPVTPYVMMPAAVAVVYGLEEIRARSLRRLPGRRRYVT